MQIRSKTYLHFISVWRSLRNSIAPHDGEAPRRTSSSLIWIAVVLASFVAILEVDLHRGELESLGLRGNHVPLPTAFLAP
ncbi:hypothetical protein J6500_05445 [Bradyrhizobium sp. WSM 1704]|nr:hypothetical protein [Bradyrhizobium semiaridum]